MTPAIMNALNIGSEPDPSRPKSFGSSIQGVSTALRQAKRRGLSKVKEEQDAAATADDA